ncbi:haloacid dehalogenase-like hydrolase superfamily protein [Striga asiatica]|uniref:Haloacid dehalogenase-like hydrolase superfamily protein n=1 Tax=Striga asiatica TaxID=4170 RepID=A0A5A7QR26_STRAF|nr:haloacid dehalogenase-like hydrolase superfamily protein [Striga asiatica]
MAHFLSMEIRCIYRCTLQRGKERSAKKAQAFSLRTQPGQRISCKVIIGLDSHFTDSTRSCSAPPPPSATLSSALLNRASPLSASLRDLTAGGDSAASSETRAEIEREGPEDVRGGVFRVERDGPIGFGLGSAGEGDGVGGGGSGLREELSSEDKVAPGVEIGSPKLGEELLGNFVDVEEHEEPVLKGTYFAEKLWDEAWWRASSRMFSSAGRRCLSEAKVDAAVEGGLEEVSVAWMVR